MNIRQLHISFNSAKTWHVIVCWFLCFPPNLHELNLNMFWTSEQNNFRFSSCKFGEKHRNNKQSHVKFWLNWIKHGAIPFCVRVIYKFTIFAFLHFFNVTFAHFVKTKAFIWPRLLFLVAIIFLPFAWQKSSSRFEVFTKGAKR